MQFSRRLRTWLLAGLLGAVPTGLVVADPDPAMAAAAARAAGPLLEALQLVEAERWPAALGAVDRARADDPDDPRLGLLRIRILMELGRLDEAEQLLDEELWERLGEPRWRPLLESYSPVVLTDWARRVALRRFSLRRPPEQTAEAARAAVAGYLGPAAQAPLVHQLAVGLVAVQVGPKAEDEALTVQGHRLLAARCPPQWAAGALLLPWLGVLLLLPWGPRSRAVAAALGLAILVVDLQVLAAGLVGHARAGAWTLLLEGGARTEVRQASVLAAVAAAASMAGVLLLGVLWRGMPAWLRELATRPTREDLRVGLRLGAGVVAWLGLLLLAQAAWRAAGDGGGLVDHGLALLGRRVPPVPPGAGWWLTWAALHLAAAPWIEEALFRGALFQRLRDALGWRGGTVVSAWAFAAAHARDPLALFGVGVLLGAARHRHDRMWPCVVAHGVWNAVALALAVVLG